MLLKKICCYACVYCLLLSSLSLTSCGEKSNEEETKASEAIAEEQTTNTADEKADDITEKKTQEVKETEETKEIDEVINVDPVKELQEMNKIAEIVYTSVANFSTEQISNDVESGSVCTKENFKEMLSIEGLDLSSSLNSSSEGDRFVYDEFTKSNSAKAIAFLGYPIKNADGHDSFIIQVKSKIMPGIIGQYPSAISEEDIDKVEWGKYFEKYDIEAELEEMNNCAKLVYEGAVYANQYFSEEYNWNFDEVFDVKAFPELMSHEGLYLLSDEELKDYYKPTTGIGDVFVYSYFIKGKTCTGYLELFPKGSEKGSFWVQVKSAQHPEIIGQYPSAISVDNYDKVKWTEFYE